MATIVHLILLIIIIDFKSLRIWVTSSSSQRAAVFARRIKYFLYIFIILCWRRVDNRLFQPYTTTAQSSTPAHVCIFLKYSCLIGISRIMMCRQLKRGVGHNMWTRCAGTRMHTQHTRILLEIVQLENQTGRAPFSARCERCHAFRPLVY